MQDIVLSFGKFKMGASQLTERRKYVLHFYSIIAGISIIVPAFFATDASHSISHTTVLPYSQNIK